ncbi:MAG: hypothetical protein B6D46_14980 [Polyangiaceae bacterium UTPRO1]|jgi:hypothetical protein|nr:DUF1566 domain-containing protein [Myxococcales bacterium]OQY64759.1 MAG: hypothetical protein B6D46_14980 [Polyangiaceae bacterium UTPRO1]
MPFRPLTTVLVLAAALGAAASIAGAAATPEQKCRAAKNKTAGQYAACRQNAEAKFAAGGDMTKYTAALDKCASKFTKAWKKAIDKAAKANATCLDAPLVVDDFQTVIDEATTNVATALAGGGLTDCSADLATVNAGTAVAGDVLAGKTFSSTAGLGVTGTMPNNGAVSIVPTTSAQTIAAGYHDGSGTVAGDTDLVPGNIKSGVEIFGVTGVFTGGTGGGLLNTGQTTSYGAGSDGDLQKGTVRSYADNGDGTITDNVTGLMWEKKSDDDSIHDKDNIYTWGVELSPYTMDGTIVTEFLAALNSGGGFAGHTDWRIPNRFELESLLDLENVVPSVDPAFNTGCMGGCTVTTCSCTQSSYYWSSTTSQSSPDSAWEVDFSAGYMDASGKSNYDYVRAVRGGS